MHATVEKCEDLVDPGDNDICLKVREVVFSMVTKTVKDCFHISQDL